MAFTRSQLWTEVLSATVLVKGKKIIFISTPKGKNHFYQLSLQPNYDNRYKYFHFKRNIINYRIHSCIIEEIRMYEENIIKARMNTKRIKQELIEAVYHPNRINKGIKKYGMDFIEYL